jgi:hypothetical protein
MVNVCLAEGRPRTLEAEPCRVDDWRAGVRSSDHETCIVEIDHAGVFFRQLH